MFLNVITHYVFWNIITHYVFWNVITHYVFCDSELNDSISNLFLRVRAEKTPTFKTARLVILKRNIFSNYAVGGRDSSVGIATRYTD